MELKFISQIRKGNNRGTGFIYLPKAKTDSLVLGDWVRVGIFKNKFFAKIIFYSHRLGIYVPKYIAIENNLINKKTEILIEKVDGFYAKMYSDGRIFIPNYVIKKQKLNHDDIILIRGIENGEVIYKKFSKVCVTKRKNRPTEYHCVFDKIFRNKELLFKIEKCPKEPFEGNLNQIMTQLLKDISYGFVNKDSVIIFKGNKVPAIINLNLKLSDFAFYLGAYFADGTKKGNSWAICASTFEQARYYLKMHNSLVRDPNPEFIVSYTNIHKIQLDKIKEKLAEIWEDRTGIGISKFRIRKPEGKCFLKWNKYGTLVIREHRQILLDIYNRLLKLLIKNILSKKDKKLAIDFLCGVMEGDGCPAANPQGSVSIWSNKNDIGVLEKILKITKMKFKICKEGENKYALKIGAPEILRNFCLLKDKIFILYPKRRKNLFERFKAVGAVKFLTENYSSTNWVKSWLKNNGFCDENYKITNKGLKLGRELLGERPPSLI